MKKIITELKEVTFCTQCCAIGLYCEHCDKQIGIGEACYCCGDGIHACYKCVKGDVK